MDNKRKLLKSPSVKRRSRVVPVNQKVTLERVLGLTATNNASLTCDPNTGTVAYPAGCVVVLINPRKARQSHILNFTKKTLTAVAFSPDGKHIVTGESGHQPAVRVWNVEDKSQVSELHGHQFGVSCVAFSPNLKYLVSIGTQHDMMVNVWNWKTGTKVASNKISSKVNAVAFSHEGSMFVTVGNRHVKFWYLDSSKSRINETVPLNGRAGILGEQKNNYFCDVACGRGVMSKAVFCITLSGLLCQFNEKRLLEKFVELRTNIANCITVGEDYIFVGCANGIVRVFNVNNLHYVSTLPHPHHLGVDVSAALSASQMVHLKENAKYPDAIATVYDDIHKKVVCIYNDHSLYIWDVHDVKKVGKAASYLYHSACVWGVETAPPLPEGLEPILPPGTFATCSSDDTIRLWNLYPNMKATSYYKKNVYSNELLKIVYIDSSLGALKDVNYNPAGGTDKTDTNYDGKNGVRSVCISPDGRHLASGDRIGNVRVHDLEKMDLIKTIEAHDGDVLCLEYSTVVNAPRLMASTSRDRLLHVYDVEQDYGTLQTLGDHSASVTAAVFADNDEQLKLLSCSADKSLLFRSAQMDPDFQFNLVQHLVGKTTLYDMTVDPTHKYVATACQDRNIRIYNIQTAKQKKHYKGSVGDDGTLIKVQLDPSGIYAATSCTDKNLCIVDFATGELVATMYGHSEISTGIKFTNDLKHLISVSGDGCVFVWRLADDMSKLMANRMEELGCTPVETVSVPTGVSDAFSLNVTSSKKEGEKAAEEQQDFMTPTKILAELIKHNESRGISPEKQAVSDYRFSIGGHLPKWAKTKIGDDKAKSQSPEDQAVKAKGRWAQRINNKGILAQVDGRTIELNANGERMSIKRFAVDETGDDTDSNIRRETMILPKAENTPRKVPVILNDEDDFDEEDDDDFFPLYQSERSSSSDPSEGKSSWDKQRNLSFGNQDDFEDMQEVIYYPPSEADSASSVESAYTVFAGNGNFNKSKRGTSTPRAQSRERNQDCDSESTEPISMDDLDEEDEGIPSIPTTPVIEEPPRTPDKDKFFRETFETLNFKAVPFETFEKSLDEIEKEANTGVNASNFGASRLSISSRFLSRSQQPNARSMGIYPGYKQDNWIDAVPKKKDQLTKTMDETRKKLMAMSWKEESPENENPPEFAEKKEETEEDDTLKDLSSSPTIRKDKKTSKSLRRSWSLMDLPKVPIHEEKQLTNRSSLGMARNKYASAYDLRKISTDQDKNQTPTNRRLDTRTSLSSGSRTRPGSLPLENKRESRGRSTADTPTSRNSSSNLTNSRKSNEGVKLSKSSSVSNLVKDKKLRDSSSESRSSSASSLKVSGSSMTLPRKSSSKKMQAIKLSSKYTSSPNLAKAFESDSENEVQDSNLQSVADLSNSTPDLLDEDDDLAGHKNRRSLPRKSNVTTSRNSFGSAAKRSQSESRIKNSRLSLPGSTPSSGRNTPNILIADDKELMPPPTGTSVMKGKSETLKSKHDKFLSKAIHSKRKTISDLTLDQAKDILKGKSGILSSNGKATDSAGVVKSARELPNISVVTSSSVAPKLSNVVSVSTSLVATVKDESKINTVSAQLEREINYTAEEIRQQKAIDALNKLSVLDASPNDLPERDYTPTHNLGTTLESSTEWDDLHSSTSIRDRIAQLNSNISLNSLRTSSPRLMSSQTLSPSVTPSKSVSAGAVSFKQVSPVNLNISPRSSSGIGSSLDSELAAKLFASPGTSPESLSSKNTVLHSGYCVDDNKNITLAEALDVVTSCHSKQSIVIPEENNAAIAPQHSNNRSSCNNDHLPLTHPQGQTPDSPCSLTTHQGVKNDNLRICMEALKDLKESVQKIRLAFEEVTKSADDNSREALTMLEDGAQETLLSLQEVLPAPKCVSSRTLPSIGNANRSPGMTHSISPPQMDASSSNVDQLLQHYSEKMVDRVELLLRDRLHTSSISNE